MGTKPTRRRRSAKPRSPRNRYQQQRSWTWNSSPTTKRKEVRLRRKRERLRKKEEREEITKPTRRRTSAKPRRSPRNRYQQQRSWTWNLTPTSKPKELNSKTSTLLFFHYIKKTIIKN